MRYKSFSGFYEINPFPGCNQICVSNHAFIPPDSRGKGLGSKQHLERLVEMKELGYDASLCTVNATNLAEIAILTRNGWMMVFTFMNRETQNQVELWARVIANDPT